MIKLLKQVRIWWLNARWGVQQIVHISPQRVALWFVVLLLNAALPFAFLAILHRFLQDLEQKQAAHLRLLLLALVALLLLMPLMQQTKQWLHSRLAENLQATLQDRLHQVILSLPYAEFERPSTHDRIHQVKADIVQQPMLLLEHSGLLVQSILFIMVMTGSLAIWRPELLLSLGGATLMMLLLGGYQSYRRVMAQRQLARLQRQAFYHSHVMTDRQFAADVRLFGLADFFRQRFLSAQTAVHQLQTTLDAEQWRFAILSSFLLISGLLGCGYFLYSDWLAGQLSLADIVIAVQSLWLGSRMLSQLVESAVKVARAGLFLGDVRQFLQHFVQPDETTTPIIRHPAVALAENQSLAIVCRDVCFAYSQHGSPVVNHLNLLIPTGQICAIMGSNGAGKSSLLKLMSGLYLPTRGQILVEGVDITSLSAEDIRSRISCMMQDAAHFQASLAENIVVGKALDNARLEWVLQTAGADEVAAKLPNQEQTLLGRLYQGTELSGGEWQRITLARALYHDAAIVLLDEPTSALDGWSEKDWFARLRTWANGRTVVVVTHRVTTAMQADMIHIMHEGQIVESGDHQQLMALNGFYQAAWSHRNESHAERDNAQ